MRVVGCEWSRERGCIVGGSAPPKNALALLEGDRWVEVQEWTGTQVTAFCVSGDAVIVAEESGIVRLFRQGSAEVVEVPGAYLAGAAPLDEKHVVLAGNKGSLTVLDIEDGHAEVTSLAALGIEKPGRNARNVIRSGDALYIVGDNRLLLQYERGRVIELLAAGSRKEREFKVHYVLSADGGLLVSGLLGVQPALMTVRDRVMEPTAAPSLGDGAPPIFRFAEGVFLLTDRLWRQTAAGWESLQAVTGGDVFIAMARTDAATLYVVSEQGRVFRAERGVWEEIAPVLR